MLYVVLVLLVVVLLIAAFWVVLARRLREGDAVAGGSYGKQVRDEKDDWGPRS